MNKKYFGTDGIRGKANVSPMTPEIALKVGMAAGSVYTSGSHRHRVVIGKDTRLSGYMIESALVAGFTSVGIDVFLLGPMPTPAVAMLTRSMRADLGVMISASHNEFEDNGIKLFGPDGFKLSDEKELEIENNIDVDVSSLAVEASNIGRAKRIDDAQARYIEFIKGTLKRNLSFEGLKIVIDCANGASYKVAPLTLWELGAEVVSIGVSPDGFNINKDCGSTALNNLIAKVLEEKADIGIALDGDADRIIVIDEKGSIVDGDKLMGLIAVEWSKQGKLKNNGIVSTLMSNLGFENYLKKQKIDLHRTKVGDRYVVECMRENNFNIGGEQSGHIVMMDYSSTGDGLLAAVQILSVLVESNEQISSLCNKFDNIPQVIKNFKYIDSKNIDPKFIESLTKTSEEKLGKFGRIVIRPSGTESLIRVMGEAEDQKLLEAVVDDILIELETGLLR
ncbi:phosphoglucosamine mutase [Hyphomicrobiales bacterium]|jgi:phosphoglucosamine mutase|nr:phosphoglucosamine mutase [Woeseiaceae bacterium]MDC0139583.1 phosphoglucosamine mutase [Hyphomicrobiales bacterium]MDC3272289.1 phosphoglucosamine mutase [Hyphomicrobiales bacterium]|tara:strand:- start:271 stop:1620 length:1350 start_codon:yes stop_codon:yes gene_type:complete